MTISTKKPLYAEVNNVPDDYEFTNEELNRIIAGDMFTPRQDAIMAREIQKLRAAMLNGDEPVSQTYKLPVNTPCQDAPAHIWLQTAGVWPEDGEFSELTWCSHNQHHDDTLYVRADLVNGNSQVTPDGWISCSERMPEIRQTVIGWNGYAVRQCVYTRNEYAKTQKGREPRFEILTGIWHGVTHWMPLPEPPEQDGE